ncbi:hypothetical protein GZH49_40415 [Nocardia terpenica]|uniref:hypothetical protein n=1 Tax=Nocardia terpenica TaxID=455432 RepID=UPI002FE34454
MDMQCQAQFQVNFDHPLFGGELGVGTTASAGLVSCMSPDGKYTNILSGTVEDSVGTVDVAPGPNPCALVLTVTAKNALVTWLTSGGGTTTGRFDYTLNTNSANPAPLGVTAKFVSGVPTPDTSHVVSLVTSPNPDCAINGLKWIQSDLTEDVFTNP